MESDSTNHSIRVLYAKDNSLVKLSKLKLNDTENVNLGQDSGICYELKLKRDTDTENKNPKVIKNEKSHPFNKHSSQHVIKYIVHNILLYFDNRSLIKETLFLNRELNNLFDIKLVTREFKLAGEVVARNDRREVHSTIEMSDYLKNGDILFDVDLEVLTKDQGWSSQPCSSSWVELSFINIADVKETAVFPIVRNFSEKNYKTVRLIWSGFKNANCNNDIFKRFAHKHNRLEVVARCQYPGWECYILEVNIKFRVLNVTR